MATTNKSLASRPLTDQRLTSQHLVNVHQAKTHLSQLLQDVEQGQDVMMARSVLPIARLVAWQNPARSLASPGRCVARSRRPMILMRPWLGCYGRCRDAVIALPGPMPQRAESLNSLLPPH
jgi:antitoxin (DNA-binding transcriptional repressor) of toxin-antitoxin stability system